MNVYKKEISLKYPLFVILATSLISIFIFADFSSYPITSIKDILYTGLQCLMVSFATLGIIGILSLNRYIFAIAYPSLALICSILAYYAITTKTTLTVMILDATLHNDWKTTSDLISPLLITCVGFCFLLSIFCAFYRFKYIRKIRYPFIYLGLFLAITLIPVNIFKVRQVLSNHLPYNLYYISSKYISERKVANEYRESLSEGSHYYSDSLTIVFVIGESLRADHLGINGYNRNTTPQLASTDNVISFPNIYTTKTYTNISIPDIMTRADSLNEDIAYKERSFIDIFRNCGFQTSWLANQESADSYVYFMQECDSLIFATINKSSYTFDKWLDESLLPHYKNQINSKYNSRLVILHTIGSHWWYNSHFTQEFAKYQPIIKSKIVSSNTTEEMINSYDNTILYTDNFIVNLIKPLVSRKAVLIYLSDHGESLGENNTWLHASDSPPIHNPACFVWLSEKYIELYPEKYNALKQNSSKRYMSDFLFHTILDGADISSPLLKKELSLFNK